MAVTTSITRDESRRLGGKPREIADYAARRKGELARLLAGCAITEPNEVRKILDNLDPADIQDERAARFLALIGGSSSDLTVEDVAKIAAEHGMSADYLRFLGTATSTPTPASEAAWTAATSIKRIRIALEEFAMLGRYAAHLNRRYSHDR